MNPLFRYFWFVCAGFVFVNSAIWRSRVNKLLSLGRVTEEERDAFIRAIVFGLGAPCLALGAVALWAGYPNPSCAGIPSFHDFGSAASSVITILVWVAILRWVWIGPGGELLSRIGPVLWRIPNWQGTYTPRAVRLVVTGLVLIATIGGAVFLQSTRLASQCSLRSPAG